MLCAKHIRISHFFFLNFRGRPYRVVHLRCYKVLQTNLLLFISSKFVLKQKGTYIFVVTKIRPNVLVACTVFEISPCNTLKGPPCRTKMYKEAHNSYRPFQLDFPNL
uniref:Uncharacterized protein n=1 Tax=Cacopsylla melanoneura TaxID=428564 RepID=A0A8D8M7X0_9HEMI